jgi:hypothetical protein
VALPGQGRGVGAAGDWISVEGRFVHSVHVMPHVLPKMGLLDPDTIRKVIDAHILVAQCCQGQIMLSRKPQEDMPEHRGVVFVPRRPSQERCSDKSKPSRAHQRSNVIPGYTFLHVSVPL